MYWKKFHINEIKKEKKYKRDKIGEKLNLIKLWFQIFLGGIAILNM